MAPELILSSFDFGILLVRYADDVVSRLTLLFEVLMPVSKFGQSHRRFTNIGPLANKFCFYFANASTPCRHRRNWQFL